MTDTLTTEQIAAYDARRRTPADLSAIMRGIRAEPHSSMSEPVVCLESRTLRVASAFASGGMLRTDVCMRPRGHKGEHQA